MKTKELLERLERLEETVKFLKSRVDLLEYRFPTGQPYWPTEPYRVTWQLKPYGECTTKDTGAQYKAKGWSRG